MSIIDTVSTCAAAMIYYQPNSYLPSPMGMRYSRTTTGIPCNTTHPTVIRPCNNKNRPIVRNALHSIQHISSTGRIFERCTWKVAYFYILCRYRAASIPINIGRLEVEESPYTAATRCAICPNVSSGVISRAFRVWGNLASNWEITGSSLYGSRVFFHIPKLLVE